MSSGRSRRAATSGRSGRSSCCSWPSRSTPRSRSGRRSAAARSPSGSPRSRRAAPAPSTSRRRELRRIERDLHDGAQARIVALGMSLGMAEQKLASDPEGAREMLAERAPRRARGARGAARPGPRHPPAGARRPRARGGHRRAREPDAAARAALGRSRPAAGAAGRERGLLHRRRGARERRQARAGRARRHRVRRRSTSRSSSRSSTTASAARPDRLGPARPRKRVEALDGSLELVEPAGRSDDGAGGDAVRVVIAEDLALLRDGLTRLLRDNGFDVVAAVSDGDALVRSGAARAARRRDRRHQAAADVPRRGPARGARAARARPGTGC